jgi:hypothetical protein
MLRGWAGTEPSGPPAPVAAEDTKILATSRYGDCASVLMLRTKAGETVAYNFVWQHRETGWTVLREFTMHEALPGPAR